MNLDRDCELCFSPNATCVRLVMECDNSSSRECCFGWCAPCTFCADECLCKCVWCEWFAKCARPVADELCPDTTGLIASANSAEPCTACGHLCVVVLRTFKGALCCASEALTRAETLLRAILFLGMISAIALLYYQYSQTSMGQLVAVKLKDVALEVVREEMRNVTGWFKT